MDDNSAFLQKKLKGFEADTAVVLGSGLSSFTDLIENPIIVPYADIPNAPTPSVSGHKGCLYAGTIGKHNVICLAGRTHLYEGLNPQYIALSTQELQKVGVKRFIATNAAGSLRTDMPAGSLMMISDHINFSARNPLVGLTAGSHFADMSEAYSPNLRQKAREIAKRENIKLFEGVYIMALGPNYETPAEVRLFHNFGADAVGMSTVPEVITAVNLGMEVMGFSVISNLGAGLSNEVLSHEDVLNVVADGSKKLTKLLQKFMEEVD